MTFTGQTADGRTISYTDGKRYLWFFSFVLALVPAVTIGLYFWTGSVFAILFPVAYMYVFIPLFDLIVGEDTHNPPEEVVDAMAADPFYRTLLHAAVPVFYLSFFAAAWFVGTQDLPWWAILVFAYGVGALHGDVLTIGHELGHKNNATDRFWAKMVNALIGYGHFCIEHNRGHHVWVSTPEDPASSRMGETIYQFAMRELPGTFKRGWEHERLRLSKSGKSFWSVENEILQGYAIALVIAAACVTLFGWHMVPFLVLHHFTGWFALTQANYVEHYGLLRQKLPNGRYEAVQPRHSWNTNHIVSNLLLFHLQRHSDHHANAQRPYQALRNFADLPRLPSGYPGTYALAMFPPLWFRIMDPKVMAWAGGDITKVNVAPSRKERLYRKYRAGEMMPA
ncbi:MAG: alkane 1-monooxygenase [Micropepsaceae bacterium]